MTVVLEGAEGFIEDLAQGSELMASMAGKGGMRAAVNDGIAIARAAVKVKSGKTKASIRGSVTVRRGEASGRVYTRVPWGGDLNFGERSVVRLYARGRALPNGGRTKPYQAHSKGRKAQPFLIPTLEESPAIDKMLEDFEGAVEKALEELVRR